ncbi:hypothetical protein CCR75_009743 [Bremia lactucae]|uniref:Uncharacterized protein n=1 Tax=Bremia lactucae TaxID=4779 RepID=A0A976ID91_BRELC|nr:hypothetical protein CCR75_009743 [Bremia lactucae]
MGDLQLGKINLKRPAKFFSNPWLATQTVRQRHGFRETCSPESLSCDGTNRLVRSNRQEGIIVGSEVDRLIRGKLRGGKKRRKDH